MSRHYYTGPKSGWDLAMLLLSIRWHPDFPRCFTFSSHSSRRQLNWLRETRRLRAEDWTWRQWPEDTLAVVCDVDSVMQVGFEMLATSLLRQLEAKLSLEIDFPRRGKLLQIYQQKLGKFSPNVLYGPEQTTLLHSVEAFQDKIRYEEISHHCSEELGIFGSPAATAAYLIYSPAWDDRAERYLQRTIKFYGGIGSVPSAFPTSLFELSWTISTLLSPVVESRSINEADLSPLASFFAETMKERNDLVGFAPGILEDADDTARSLLTLMRLGHNGQDLPVDLEPMVSKFETTRCFQTYESERNPSFSANCNVLLAMLEFQHGLIEKFARQIEKALTFLLSRVETRDRLITDKWNISSEYSYRLLIEVLALALKTHDAGFLQQLPRELFEHRIPKILCRIVSQVLAGQGSDGSWTKSMEVTSYSVLALTHSLRMPWCATIRDHFNDCILRAQNFLQAEFPRVANSYCDYLWIEKTTFQSSLLRMAYCSAALHTQPSSEEWSSLFVGKFTTINSDSQCSGMKKLFSSLPFLRGMPLLLMDLAITEAKFHAADLATKRDSILPRSDLPLTKDKYLLYIPVIWLLCNLIHGQTPSAGILEEMISLSQLTFQVDEYMETTVAKLSSEQETLLKVWIQRECLSLPSEKCDSNGVHIEGPDKQGSQDLKAKNRVDDCQVENSLPQVANEGPGKLSSIQGALRKFIKHVLDNDAVLRTVPSNRHSLAVELCDYLLAHIQQNIDNVILAARKDKHGAAVPLPSSYIAWARGTGADHTSCPFAYRFFTCLIDGSGRKQQQFDTAKAQYFSSSIARHLATMCRQFNDYGSIERDAEESNLNSVDFAEFDAGARVRASSAKESLLAIAEFERQLMKLSLRALENVSDSADTVDALKVFIDVTDLFGLLYVAKDIASRKR